MTTPGGVPNLPVGALTLDTLASKLQDMTTGAMRARASEQMPSTFHASNGGDPMSDATPFGILTTLWAGFNSNVATADPADIDGPEDLPDLLMDFINSLPVVSQFISLTDAILGNYVGEDPMLLAIQDVFAPIRELLKLVADIGSGIPTPGEITAGWDALSTAVDDAITTGDWNPLLIALFGAPAVGATVQQSAIPSGIPQAKVSGLVAALSDAITTGSWNALLTALFGGTAVGSTVQPAAIPDIDLSLSSAGRDIVDFMNQVTGTGSTTGNPTGTVTDVFQSIWGAILFATQLAQEANSSNAATSVSGTVFSDSFGRLATDMGSGRYSITRTGISHAFPDGLRAAWSAGDTGTESDRTIVSTQTDYQRVTLVLDNTLAGPGALNQAAGRCNTARNSKVFFEVDRSNQLIRLYRRLTGTNTLLASAAYIPAAGDAIDLDLGDPETLTPRAFRVSVNGAPVIDWTTDSTSAFGVSNRFAELVWIPSPFGAPSLLRNFTMRDTVAPTYVGSGARMCRTATGGVNLSNGVNPLPSNFFGSTVESTEDITPNLIDGTFQVRDADWYRFKASIKTDATNWTTAVAFLLYRNTSPWLYGGTDHIRGISALSTAVVPRWVGDEWEVYLQANDTVGLGYDSNGTALGSLTGESTGLQTYFTITRGRR